jgi:hypothetical protein
MLAGLQLRWRVLSSRALLDFSWLRRPIQRRSPIPERWRQRLLGIE